MSRSPSLATTGAPTFWPTARSSSTRRVVLEEGNSGVSSTSLTVIVTMMVSSMSPAGGDGVAVGVLPVTHAHEDGVGAHGSRDRGRRLVLNWPATGVDFEDAGGRWRASRSGCRRRRRWRSTAIPTSAPAAMSSSTLRSVLAEANSGVSCRLVTVTTTACRPVRVPSEASMLTL